MIEVPHQEITRNIIGAAITVLNALKPGLDEKLYENALVIEMAERGLRVDQQLQYPVHYKGHFIGKLVPDLIVEGKVIVDAKVVTEIHSRHYAQMLGYLTITGLDIGLILNFHDRILGKKRVLNRAKYPQHGDGEDIQLH